ncbi:hypothetical protein P0082_11770 [Candidatus Haliotispira prima]|uniref:Uncharacterized protein n=1 Tax=Candidatus Haliotispira prima TaxID=3034016 RepID=A0ABY8MIW9_9SPIO|nr:hypothetical protein P0082_11770 [Candidatus Haliotispira prima]
MELANIGAVVRLAAEAAPTKAEAQASAGHVSIRIPAAATRKISISQHYTTNFDDGLTPDDVLTPNTAYKLYLFFEANAIPSETTVEGATLNNDVVTLSFSTATLPPAGDAVWDEAWTGEQFVGNLAEWGYSENQKGVFVAYTKINFSPTIIAFTCRAASDTLLKPIGTFSVGSAIPDPQFLFNLSKLGGSYPDADNYYYIISADKTGAMSGKTLQLEITDSPVIAKLRAPLTRYDSP